MSQNKGQGFSTRAIHAGQKSDPSTGAIMTPIYQTSTYAQKSPGQFIGYEYSRTDNPTRHALEDNLASLENGDFGVCFASGCAALSAVLHLLETGDHVVVCDDVYGGTLRIFEKIFKPLGIQYTQVCMTDLNLLKTAFQKNTRLVWLETPTNPMLQIIDIEAVSELAHQIDKNIIVAVDNTFATPYLQNPLDLGADLVCHSTTKYLGGHSDVIGGVIIGRDLGLKEQIRFIQNAVGAVPAPMDCFLLLRSTKTLAVRMQKHCDNARFLAEYLSGHKQIEKVIYPGLPSHPQHTIAKNQMRDFGGMISVVLKGGLGSSKAFLEKVQLFSLAESLGGVESLIEHPALMTHASISPENRKKLGILDGLVRLSVGIEDVVDLQQDLQQALS